MKYKVDNETNFCRVFKLPENYPSQFCFGGGIPVEFKMVDWFNPVRRDKDEISLEELQENLIPFLKDKNYIEEKAIYLVLCDFGASFIFIRES